MIYHSFPEMRDNILDFGVFMCNTNGNLRLIVKRKQIKEIYSNIIWETNGIIQINVHSNGIKFIEKTINSEMKSTNLEINWRKDYTNIDVLYVALIIKVAKGMKYSIEDVLL